MAVSLPSLTLASSDKLGSGFGGQDNGQSWVFAPQYGAPSQAGVPWGMIAAGALVLFLVMGRR
ncbi:hypothetical protein [Parvularcula sp. LCG005]|uniref:hypothetical protein n=1 Tax=Parvularcula sp. LCG005 TaxID=3078805 RepID=UPI0029435A7F|nr:hypothetical protein [Parvularcula sp. LCG005]WOI51972.1 hypothetical protein RUI03_07360 [Parvularcula sp. LCG005]